jgi:hypothetical protein
MLKATDLKEPFSQKDSEDDMRMTIPNSQANSFALLLAE